VFAALCLQGLRSLLVLWLMIVVRLCFLLGVRAICLSWLVAIVDDECRFINIQVGICLRVVQVRLAV